jgi:hypothetical protein
LKNWIPAFAGMTNRVGLVKTKRQNLLGNGITPILNR